MVAVLAALWIAGVRPRGSVPPAEGRDAATLVAVARTFEANYDHGHYGAVYDRFDAASRAVIARASYVARHLECPDPPGAATVLWAHPAQGAWWEVRYEISHVALTDWWRYLGGVWRFDLARSNPSAVALYRLPFAQYRRAVGC